MTLNIVLCLVLYIHFLDVTSSSIDCTGEIYKRSNGFSCYPCGPGFHVLKECTINGTTNACVPCPKGYFQSECTAQATRCKPCGSCYDPRQEVARNCTKSQDTVCACTKGYHKDISRHICAPHCPPGNKIVLTQGDEWEGSLCVPCEAGTFSTEENSTECAMCTSCSDYINNCTRRSDAVCKHQTTKDVTTASNQQTTKKVTSTSTTSHSPDNGQKSPHESGMSDAEIALTVLTIVLFIICMTGAAVIIIKRQKKSKRLSHSSTKRHPSIKTNTIPLEETGIETTGNETENPTHPKTPLLLKPENEKETTFVKLDENKKATSPQNGAEIPTNGIEDHSNLPQPTDMGPPLQNQKT